MTPILVPTDGSESAKAAARAAFELARAHGDPLLFVTVWRELRGDWGIPLPFTADAERDWATETLAEAVADAEAAGLDAEAVSRHGAPADEICEVARERGAQLIVIGSRGAGPIEGALLGSVSSRVLHHAPCPVLVVPERAHAHGRAA